MQLTLINVIERQLESRIIPQRASDGYINATAMCQAAGKLFGGYRRTAETQAFLEELARSMQIRIDPLIVTIMDGQNEERGTWVHPHVAVSLEL